MNNHVIRKACPGDIDDIYNIELEAFVKPWPLEGLKKELRIAHSCFIVAEDEGRVAGYAIAWIIVDEIHLLKIAVASSLRRLGIATSLLNYFINRYEDTCFGIMLEVREKNTIARNFYRELGFIENGFRKNYYPDDNAILIEKML